MYAHEPLLLLQLAGVDQAIAILFAVGLTLPLLDNYTIYYFCVLLHYHIIHNHTCICTLLQCNSVHCLLTILAVTLFDKGRHLFVHRQAEI